jgi:hypothetical protein
MKLAITIRNGVLVGAEPGKAFISLSGQSYNLLTANATTANSCYVRIVGMEKLQLFSEKMFQQLSADEKKECALINLMELLHVVNAYGMPTLYGATWHLMETLIQQIGRLPDANQLTMQKAGLSIIYAIILYKNLMGRRAIFEENYHILNTHTLGSIAMYLKLVKSQDQPSIGVEAVKSQDKPTSISMGGIVQSMQVYSAGSEHRLTNHGKALLQMAARIAPAGSNTQSLPKSPHSLQQSGHGAMAAPAVPRGAGFEQGGAHQQTSLGTNVVDTTSSNVMWSSNMQQPPPFPGAPHSFQQSGHGAMAAPAVPIGDGFERLGAHQQTSLGTNVVDTNSSNVMWSSNMQQPPPFPGAPTSLQQSGCDMEVPSSIRQAALAVVAQEKEGSGQPPQKKRRIAGPAAPIFHPPVDPDKPVCFDDTPYAGSPDSHCSASDLNSPLTPCIRLASPERDDGHQTALYDDLINKGYCLLNPFSPRTSTDSMRFPEVGMEFPEGSRNACATSL